MTKNSFRGIRIDVSKEGKMDKVETLRMKEGKVKHRRYTPTNKSLKRVLELRETKFKYEE